MIEPNGQILTPSSRRGFLKATAIGGAAVTRLGFVPMVHAAGEEIIKVGLIGCGGQGRGAADDPLCEAEQNVKSIAPGDAFRDQIAHARNALKPGLEDRLDVPEDRRFIGFDPYKRMIDSGVDLVILATPGSGQ